MITLPEDLAVVVYAIAAFGLAYIVGHAQISRRPREFAARVVFGRAAVGEFFVDLLECPACFGFWTGLVAGALGVTPNAPTGVAGALLFGLFTSGSNLLLALSVGIVQRPTDPL